MNYFFQKKITTSTMKKNKENESYIKFFKISEYLDFYRNKLSPDDNKNNQLNSKNNNINYTMGYDYKELFTEYYDNYKNYSSSDNKTINN